MGATLSTTAARTSLYISSVPGITDDIAQLYIENSGWPVDAVIPSPGWEVEQSDTNDLVLRFMPNKQLRGTSTFSATLIAECTWPLNVDVRVCATNQIVWNWTDTADSTWEVVPVNLIPSTLMVLLNPVVVLAQSMPVVTPVAVDYAKGPIVWTVSDPFHFAVSDTTVVVVNPLPVGMRSLTIMATDNYTSVSGHMQVIVQPAIAVKPTTEIVLNANNHIGLTPEWFDPPDQHNSYTHIRLDLRASSLFNVVYKGALVTEPMPSFPRCEINSLQINNHSRATPLRHPKTLLLPRTLLGHVKNQRVLSPLLSAPSSPTLVYWLSHDRGLSYPETGQLAIVSNSCFDNNVWVCTARDRTKWKPVCALQQTDQVWAMDAKAHSIKSLPRSLPVVVLMVCVPPHALGPNQPNRVTYLTTNHVVGLFRQGRWTTVWASQLPSLYPVVTLVQRQQQVLCHVELDTYQFLWANNMVIESMAATSHDNYQRLYMLKHKIINEKKSYKMKMLMKV